MTCLLPRRQKSILTSPFSASKVGEAQYSYSDFTTVYYLILSIVCRQRLDLDKYQGNLKRMPAKQHEDASAYFERIGNF